MRDRSAEEGSLAHAHLVPCGGEMRRDLVVDRVYMFRFIDLVVFGDFGDTGHDTKGVTPRQWLKEGEPMTRTQRRVQSVLQNRFPWIEFC